MRPGLRSGAIGSFGRVRSNPFRPGGRRVRWGRFGPFPCVLGAHLVWSIPVHPRGLRVRSYAFGSFPLAGAVVRLVLSALGRAVVGFVQVGSVHSRASWGSSCLVHSCAP